MKIIFFGAGTFGLPTLAKLHRGSHRLLGIVTSADKPQGRGLRLAESPIRLFAKENRIPVLPFSNPNSPEALRELQQIGADAFVVVSFGVIFSKAFLTLPKFGCINLHASLLPSYRGASPIAYALLNGDRETGVSTMKLVERLDAGDVLMQKRIPLKGDENAEELFNLLSQEGAALIEPTLTGLESGSLKPQPQNERLATLAPKIKKSDGVIDWKKDARAIHNQVRAFYVWPGSKTTFNRKPVILKKTSYNDRNGSENAPQKPGAIIGTENPGGIEVATGKGTLLIQDLQPEGKKVMTHREFLSGYRAKVGECFNA